MNASLQKSTKMLDKELKDLISANETLNVGIKKIFKEINKKDNNN